ncbi:GIDE domain-containing protein [Haloglomus litoreum]|uniref:GIDE domain-containing protein n=1 Tax=Haloglomus litoreum TaxID=3034026 RepID=UPI0023E84559|nr:GIDE domain-containing protein [Haloglomus sp. DT116]
MAPLAPLPLQAVPLPVAAIFGGIGLVLVGLALREVWLAVRYRSRRPTPVGDLSEASGTISVTGIARRADDLVTAPITRRDCLAYGWRVTDLRTVRGFDGSIETRTSEVGRGRDSVPFVVEDETGSVRVDPEGAEFRLAEEWVADPEGDPVDRADVLAGLGSLGGEARARRYYESRLDEGETVTVRGRVTTDDSLAASRLGVRITGGGIVVEDATPGAAARRAVRRALYSGLSGLFMLVVLAFLLGWLP